MLKNNKSSNLSFDWFQNTSVFKVLKNSKRVQKKYKGKLSDIWLPPEAFFKAITEYILERTAIYDMDFWILHYGYEGSAKTSGTIKLYNDLMRATSRNPFKWLYYDVILMQAEYSKTLYNYGKLNETRHPIIIDDAHFIFGKYYATTSETLALLQLARFNRSQQIIHLLNTQTPTQLVRDIWQERVNVYIYHFAIDVVSAKTGKIIDRWFYMAFYNMESSQILRLDEDTLRQPLFWRKTITKHPPDLITRIDPLFSTYSDLYGLYKRIKKFYQQFYSYMRYLGVTKGKYYEIVFNILHLYSQKHTGVVELEKDMNETIEKEIDKYLSSLPSQTIKKLEEYGILRWNAENKHMEELNAELIDLAIKHADIIQTRATILQPAPTSEDLFRFGEFEKEWDAFEGGGGAVLNDE